MPRTTIEPFIQEAAKYPELRAATSTATGIPDVELHHLGQAIAETQVQVSAWEHEPVSRLWTTWRGVPVAHEDMARGEDDLPELRRLSLRLIERTRVMVERERADDATERARLLQSLSWAAEQYAQASFQDVTGAFSVIRLSHDRAGISGDELAAIIQQALDARKDPARYAGQAAESWSADIARRWVDEALRSEVTGQDEALLFTGELPGEDRRSIHVSPVTAVEQASADAIEAVRARDAAIREAVRMGASQKQIAAAAQITQGRVSQIVSQANEKA